MDKFIIEGGRELNGVVEISGAKNAALPLLAATLLTTEPCTLRNVPDLRDIRTMRALLSELGVEVEQTGTKVQCQTRNESLIEAPYDLVRQMRASFCVLGPLLARRGKAKVSLPGGCVIGLRPIDLHIKGLRALGAEIKIEHGYIMAETKGLRGADIYLGGAFGSTVTGTANVLMAAVLAEGITTIENAACEPEIADLAAFLSAMGAKISGAGTPTLVIEGVTALGGCDYEVVPDRIEAATFILAALITRGDIAIKGARLKHLRAVVDKLAGIGAHVYEENGLVRVKRGERLASTDVTTLPYPGFPTDIQAQLITALALADGISVVTEKIYPDRFMHVAELNRMGAQIRKEGPTAIILGQKELSGAQVMASDLRASAALVLAGLVATGNTEILRVYHIDRGYDGIEKKLRALGAVIERVQE